MKKVDKREWLEFKKPIGEPELVKDYKEESYRIERKETSEEVIWYGWNTNWRYTEDKGWEKLKHNGFVKCDEPIYETLYKTNKSAYSKLNLKEFIKQFIQPNTLIRLWTKEDKDYAEVFTDDSPQMEHELINTPYAEKKVVGITDIVYLGSPYQEAVNIIIENPWKVVGK